MSDENNTEEFDFWNWKSGGPNALIKDLKEKEKKKLVDQEKEITKNSSDIVGSKDAGQDGYLYTAKWRNDWIDGIDKKINDFNTSEYTTELNNFFKNANDEEWGINKVFNDAAKALGPEGAQKWINDNWKEKGIDPLVNWASFTQNDFAQTLLTDAGNYTNDWLTNWLNGWLGGEAGSKINNPLSPGGASKEKGKFVVSNIKVGEKNKNKETYNVINPYIKKMFEAGPDLFSNSFDIFFIIDSPNGKDFLSVGSVRNGNLDKNLGSLISNYSDLAIRTASVSIPQRMQSSYTQKILNLSTEMVSHSVEFENKAELKIDLDSSLSVIDLINSLSGLPDYTMKSSKVDDSDNEKDEEKEKYTFTDNKSENDTWGTSYSNSSNTQRLDIFVNSRSFKNMHSLYWNPNAESSMNNIIYVFYNCKFLGTDSVSFSRDSVDVQNKSFPFIFEHLYEVYKMVPDINEPEDKTKTSISIDKFKDTKNDILFVTHL